MDGLLMFLVVLLGVVSYSHGQISGSGVEVTVRPGDNITLYCDCKLSTGVYILWYRNCSHENQPPLIFQLKFATIQAKTANSNFYVRVFPRFQFVRNYSSDSYDLLITNITELDEGLYYCGTEKPKVEDKEFITSMKDYRYGNITTRLTVNSSSCPDSMQHVSKPPYVSSWLMMFTPAFTVLTSFLSFILIYNFFQKADKEPQILQKRSDTTRQTKCNEAEDVCSSRVVYRAKAAQ